jgi:predicted transcriptional regulator
VRDFYGMVSVVDILAAISDDKSLLLFKTIALSDIESNSSDTLLGILHFTRKQYYSRMDKLAKAGLVLKKNGKYLLTNMGRIVYDAQTTLEKVVGNYWKLKAVDALEMSDEFQDEEYDKIINALIDNEQLKERLSKSHSSLSKDLQARSSSSYQSPRISEIYT